MPIQTTTVARARNTDPQTSHDAAESVKRIEEQRRAIFALLDGTPMCDEKLVEQYEMWEKIDNFPQVTPQRIRTARADLVKLGQVVATEYKERMRSGRYGIIWRVTA